MALTIIYIVVALVVAAISFVAFFYDDGDYRNTDENALRVLIPLLAGAIWPIVVTMATMIGGMWLLGAVVRAWHFRHQWREARQGDNDDLVALGSALGDLDARIFGSCVNWFGGYSRRTQDDYHHDIDVMVVVSAERFAEWTALAYEEGEVDCYDELHPTRYSRRNAAERVLGVKFPKYLDLDVFLFAEEYVEGRTSVPAWDGSFRREVLSAAKPLQRLRLASPMTMLRYKEH